MNGSYMNGEGGQGYKGNYYDERTWWDYLPSCLSDILVSCGATRPERNNSRLAWSADERQRYWRFEQGADNRGIVDDRQLGRSFRGPRDNVMLEDLDGGRLHRQSQVMRVDSRSSQQEPRRVFVLRDAKGNPRSDSQLREGETYLIEDVDDVPRPLGPGDARSSTVQVMNIEDDATFTRQGNAEVLRLHASPRDGAMPIERLRRHRQAGVEPGGTVIIHDDNGDNYRIIEGQSVGVSPRSEYEIDDGRGYGQPIGIRYINEGGPQSEAQIQTDDNYTQRISESSLPPLRIGSPIQEETASLLEAEGAPSTRDRGNKRQTIKPELHKTRADIEREDRKKIERARQERAEKDRIAMENADRERENRALAEKKRGDRERAKKYDKVNKKVDNRSENTKIPKANKNGQNGYGDTKTSILRYKARKDKLEEERDSSASRRSSLTGQEGNEIRRKVKSEKQRSSNQPGEAHDETELQRERVEKHGSVQEHETLLEREAARRGDRTNKENDESHQDISKRGGNISEMPPVEVRAPGEGQSDSSYREQSNNTHIHKDSTNIYNSESVILEGNNSTDDAKSWNGEENHQVFQNTAFDQADNSTTDVSKNNLPPRKRSSMMAKKSIFTIAYDDMLTEQLRPESAPTEP